MPSATHTPWGTVLTTWAQRRWFACLSLVMMLAALVLACYPAIRLDIEIYRIGAQTWLDGSDLYGKLADTHHGFPMPFTYPPLAAVLFAPLTLLSLIPATALFNLLCLIALTGVVWVVVRRMTTMDRLASLWLTFAVTALCAFLGPNLRGFVLGQINIILMALVLVDAFVVPPKYRGWLTGLAVSIKLTPAVFGLYWLVKWDWKRIIAMGASVVVCTGLGFLLAPADSIKYWGSVLWDPSRIGGQAYAGNQSFTGELFRLGIMDATGRGKMVWAVLVVLALAWIAVVVTRLRRQGHDFLALVACGFFGLLASPVSWDHHWTWVTILLVVLGFHAMSFAEDPPTGRSEAEKSGEDIQPKQEAHSLHTTQARTKKVLLGLVVSGLVCFALAPVMLPVPQEDGRELSWTWWDHIVGNLFLAWVLIFLVALWPLGRRLRPVSEGFC